MNKFLLSSLLFLSFNNFSQECPISNDFITNIFIDKTPTNSESLFDLFFKCINQQEKHIVDNNLSNNLALQNKISKVLYTLQSFEEDNFSDSFLDELQVIADLGRNNNYDAQILFLSFKPENNGIKDTRILELFSKVKDEIFSRLSENRKRNFQIDDLVIKTQEDAEVAIKELNRINFYSLPSKYEKTIYLDKFIRLQSYDIKDLKKITNYFLYHYPDKESSYISTSELTLYANFSYQLLNSDLRNYVQKIEEKFIKRTGISYKELPYYARNFLWAGSIIYTYVLNISSYEFMNAPFRFDTLMREREGHIEYLQEYKKELLNYYEMDEAEVSEFAGLGSWLSDTAIKLSDNNQEGDCVKALEYFDQAFALYEKIYRNIEFISENDPFTEPAIAANCAIKAYEANKYGIALADKYYSLASNYKNLVLIDKFEDLYYQLIGIKILYYKGNHDITYRKLLDINNKIFSKEFIEMNYREIEYFNRSISIYSLLFSYLTELKEFDNNLLKTPIEWIDLKSSFFENDTLTKINLDLGNKKLTTLQAQFKELNEEISSIEDAFLADNDSKQYEALQQKFQERRSLRDSIYSINSNLKSFVDYDSTHFKKFQNNLADDQYILSIHFGMQDSYVYLATKNNFKTLFVHSNASEASSIFQAFNQAIDANKIQDIPLYSTFIYRKFFEQILKDVPENSTIFLYGNDFNHIAMNALSTGHKDIDDDYERMINTNWLIKKYKFAYLEPFYSYSRNLKAYDEQFLGIANPDINEIKDLPALPSAERELLRISLINGSGTNNLLLNKNATYKNLKSKLKKTFKNIVFATHAITSSDLEGTQGLVLTNPEKEDFVSIIDIIELGISSDLVVLSSCFPDKRNYQYFTTNENPPISRAFLLAGSSSVISSTWEIDTLTSSRITQSFFEKMISNQSSTKFDALRNANLDILNDFSSIKNIYPKSWANMKITYKDHYSL